jgi:hypothetical protein
MAKRGGAHEHFYVQDTRDGRTDFVVCKVCGFSTHKRHILQYWAVFDRNLSPEILAERKAGKK